MNMDDVIVLGKVVPVAHYQAIKRYPWIECKPSEWNNRSPIENAVWLIGQLVKKDEEHEASFDLRWKADMRGIKMWQKEKPKARKLVWPNHADLVCWLIEQLDKKGSL